MTVDANRVSDERIWLVTAGDDGALSKLVVGFDAMKEAVVRCVWDDPTGEEGADQMREELDDPDFWSGDWWSCDWAFEDGYLRVQRVTDTEALRRSPSLSDIIAAKDAEIAEVRRNAWCPDVCPITGRHFFMWIDGEPTYGGPFDSYTIPTKDAEGEYSCRRYDHDEGGWKDWTEGLSIKVVDESDWLGLEDRAEAAEARANAAEEALRPFAEAVERYDAFWLEETGGQDHLENEGDEMVTFFALGSDVDLVPLNAFRAALSALNGAKRDAAACYRAMVHTAAPLSASPSPYGVDFGEDRIAAMALEIAEAVMGNPTIEQVFAEEDRDGFKSDVQIEAARVLRLSLTKDQSNG